MSQALNDDRLLLLAQEPSEVPVLSALLQDAVVPLEQLVYDARGRRLVLLASRYRWEAGDRSRVRSAVRIDSVLGAQRRGWPADPTAMLSLLAVTADGGTVTLQFSGSASIRLTVECIDMVLEDVTSPWPAVGEPAHD